MTNESVDKYVVLHPFQDCRKHHGKARLVFVPSSLWTSQWPFFRHISPEFLVIECNLHLFLFVFFLVNSFFLIVLFVLVISIADHLAAVEGLWLSIIECDQVHRILKQLCRAHGLIHALLESSISNPNTQHKRKPFKKKQIFWTQLFKEWITLSDG